MAGKKEDRDWVDAKRKIKKELGVFISFVKGRKVMDAIESWNVVLSILEDYEDESDDIDLDI